MIINLVTSTARPTPSQIKELNKLGDFRPPNYHKPNVFWGMKGEGVRIDQLSNVFDEDYDMQTKKNKI